ncbi:MAG: hypothetical protein GF383_16510 [Candidatus Lokiarchaeota archaeon]|nr:hypothetical protein [Candidatus Lokiarchaeota archaeon]
MPFNQMFERIQEEAAFFHINVDYTPEWYTSLFSCIDENSIGKKQVAIMRDKRDLLITESDIMDSSE